MTASALLEEADRRKGVSGVIFPFLSGLISFGLSQSIWCWDKRGLEYFRWRKSLPTNEFPYYVDKVGKEFGGIYRGAVRNEVLKSSPQELMGSLNISVAELVCIIDGFNHVFEQVTSENIRLVEEKEKLAVENSSLKNLKGTLEGEIKTLDGSYCITRASARG